MFTLFIHKYLILYTVQIYLWNKLACWTSLHSSALASEWNCLGSWDSNHCKYISNHFKNLLSWLYYAWFCSSCLHAQCANPCKIYHISQDEEFCWNSDPRGWGGECKCLHISSRASTQTEHGHVTCRACTLLIVSIKCLIASCKKNAIRENNVMSPCNTYLPWRLRVEK